MKETILFDIDYTLLNATVSKQNYREKISKLVGVSVDDYMVVEKDYMNRESGFTDFHPDDYIKHMCRNYNVDEVCVREVFFDDQNFVEALYPDVIPALEKLSESYGLGIFSEGFEDFQMTKLHKSGLSHFFKKDLTFIFRRKLMEGALNMLPENCFIVEDNPSVIDALVEFGRVQPVWLNRKSEEKHREIPTIGNLENLKEILNSFGG